LGKIGQPTLPQLIKAPNYPPFPLGFPLNLFLVGEIKIWVIILNGLIIVGKMAPKGNLGPK